MPSSDVTTLKGIFLLKIIFVFDFIFRLQGSRGGCSHCARKQEEAILRRLQT